MKEEILINATAREVRAALVDSGVLQEVLIERASRRGLISNIYKGKVSRVLPGMQAAFVDSGSSARRSCMLPTSRARAPAQRRRAAPADARSRHPRVRARGPGAARADPEGAARHEGRAAHHLHHDSVALSRDDAERAAGSAYPLANRGRRERERLRSTLEMLIASRGRAGRLSSSARRPRAPSDDALRADMLFLAKIWKRSRSKATRTPPGELVYEDLPLPLRVLRDSSGAGIAATPSASAPPRLRHRHR